MAGKLPVVSVVLRVLAFVSFFASAIILYFSYQKQELKKVPVVAEYQNGFQFCMILNAILFVYNLMVFFIPAGSPLWKTVASADKIMIILIGVSITCNWQTYLLMRKRDADVGCRSISICRILPFFCSKLLGSVITSSFGFLFSFVLLIYILIVGEDPFLMAQ